MARVFQKRDLFIPGPVLSPALSAEQDSQVVDGDEVLVHGRLTELPVDHDPAGAGQVGAEEEQEWGKSDQTLDDQVQPPVLDPEGWS